MTTQRNLGLVWASTGGTLDPTDEKYSLGWEVEIPTYQNFNFVLNNNSRNILVGAEQRHHNWEDSINYVSGARVLGSDGVYYTCTTDNINQDPTTDSINNYWVTGDYISAGGSDTIQPEQEFGFYIENMGLSTSTNTWTTNDITLRNSSAFIGLYNKTNGFDNLVLGNSHGELVVFNTGNTTSPDGRSTLPNDNDVHRIYHEGHKPDITDVENGVEEAPLDGKYYSRRNGNWLPVTSTTVSNEPPPALLGAGQGWYNLADGHFYIDVDDGNSSQWVPASPPQVILSGEPVVPDVEEAPIDGKQYARKDASWVEVEGGGDSETVNTTDILNPLDKANDIILAENNTIAHKDVGSNVYTSVRGVLSKSTGKYQIRFKSKIPLDNSGTGQFNYTNFVGICDSEVDLNSNITADTGDYIAYSSYNNLYRIIGEFPTSGLPQIVEDIALPLIEPEIPIDIFIDLDDGLFSVKVDGVAQGSVKSIPTGAEWFPFVSVGGLNDIYIDLTGESFTPEEGYKVWNTEKSTPAFDFKMEDATDAERYTVISSRTWQHGGTPNVEGAEGDVLNAGGGKIYLSPLDIDGIFTDFALLDGATANIYYDDVLEFPNAVISYDDSAAVSNIHQLSWAGIDATRTGYTLKIESSALGESSQPLVDGDAWVYNESEGLFRPTQIGSPTSIANGIGSISIDSDGNISSSSKSILVDTEEDGDLACLLGNGGGLFIISGTENPFGTGVADSGGIIRLKAGDSKADDGGAIILQAGDCVHEDSRAGSVTFEAGSGQYGVNVDGGSATIQAGQSDSGQGGSAFLKGGSNSSSSENAGSVYIESGSNSDDANRSGSVFISGGGNNRGQIILGRDISYIKAGTELNMEEAVIKGGEATFDTLRSDTLGTDTYDLPIDAPSAGQVMVAQSSSETAWVTPDASVPTVVVTEFPASPDANTLYIKVV